MCVSQTVTGVLQAEGAEEGGDAAPMEVSAPSTSGAAADSPAAANGTAEAATPGAEGTAKKVKKEKKVCAVSYSTAACCVVNGVLDFTCRNTPSF